MNGGAPAASAIVADRVRRWLLFTLEKMGAASEADAVADFTLMLLARQGNLKEMPDVAQLANGPASVAVGSVLGRDAVKRFRQLVTRQSSPGLEDLAEPPDSAVHVVASNYRGLLLEALQAIAAPEVADAMVQAALREGRLAEVPAEIEDFARFVKYAVFDEVMSRFGPDEAGAVMEQMQPIIEVARLDSGVHRRSQPSKPALDESAGPLVLLVGSGMRMTGFNQWLEEAGCAVTRVESAPGALAQCGRELPHVIVCEIGLAGVGGVHLALVLRRLYGDDTPPVLMVGASPNQGDDDFCFALPADIRRQGLVDAVDQALALYEDVSRGDD